MSISPLTSHHEFTAAVRSAADMVLPLDAVESAMTALGYLPRDIFGVRLALEEALVSAGISFVGSNFLVA